MKPCFKCGLEKPPSEFYAHPMMSDKTLGKCKDCTKVDVRRNRAIRVERIREYDRVRTQSPESIARRKRITEEWARKHPEWRKAQVAVGNAVRDGRLKKAELCEGCSRPVRITAHHHDYGQPLLVMWLCKSCHAIADKIRRKFEAA